MLRLDIYTHTGQPLVVLSSPEVDGPVQSVVVEFHEPQETLRDSNYVVHFAMPTTATLTIVAQRHAIALDGGLNPTEEKENNIINALMVASRRVEDVAVTFTSRASVHRFQGRSMSWGENMHTAEHAFTWHLRESIASVLA